MPIMRHNVIRARAVQTIVALSGITSPNPKPNIGLAILENIKEG